MTFQSDLPDELQYDPLFFVNGYTPWLWTHVYLGYPNMEKTWKTWNHGKQHLLCFKTFHLIALIIILIALCILFTPCDAILFLNSLVPDGKNNSKVGCQWGAKARPARIEHVDLSIGINYQQLGFVGISWEYNFHITWWCTVSIQPNWYDIWYLMVSLKIGYLNFDGVSPCFSR